MKTHEIISEAAAIYVHHLLSERCKNLAYFASESAEHIAHDVLSLRLYTVISPVNRGRLEHVWLQVSRITISSSKEQHIHCCELSWAQDISTV